MKHLVIIGAGGFGREIAQTIEDTGKWKIDGFLDDNIDLLGHSINGYKVLGPVAWLHYHDLPCVIAIGDCDVIKKISKSLNGIDFPVIIHPSNIISKYVSFGGGAIVMAGNLFTVNIEVGNNTIFNRGSVISHDDIIGKCCVINSLSSISGNDTLGDGVYIGTGTKIIEGIIIGGGSVIGAGSVITKNIPDNVVAYGSPAKVIRDNK
jgi:sugar O-acyltransferase (sialic acid O-acetyltransferase NeuD family)